MGDANRQTDRHLHSFVSYRLYMSLTLGLLLRTLSSMSPLPSSLSPSWLTFICHFKGKKCFIFPSFFMPARPTFSYVALRIEIQQNTLPPLTQKGSHFHKSNASRSNWNSVHFVSFLQSNDMKDKQIH